MESSYSVSTLPSWTTRISIAGFVQRTKTLRQILKSRSMLLTRSTNRRLRERPVVPTDGGDSKAMRTTLMLALFGYATATTGATYDWQKDVLIPVGLEPQSETVLRIPEPIKSYFPENQSAVAISEVDNRTLTIKPLVPDTEQRLFVLGESSNLYVAKLSTKLRHVAVIEVQYTITKPEAAQATLRSQGAISSSYLLVQMIQNNRLPGFAVSPWTRQILASDEYVITGEQVWSSPSMTGVVAKIARAAGVSKEVRINPEAIQISIPAFGRLRVISADRWTLDNNADQSPAQLVFTKD